MANWQGLQYIKHFTYDLNKGMVGGSYRMKHVNVSTKIFIY